MWWVKCSYKFPDDWIDSVLRQISTKKIIKEEEILSVENEYFKMEEMEGWERKRIYFNDVEWLDESGPSISISDIGAAWQHCCELWEERSGRCIPPELFHKYLKDKYNIDVDITK